MRNERVDNIWFAYSYDITFIVFSILVLQFFSIFKVLLKKLNQFEGDGFEPSNGFVFGFSFDAQLVINAGRDFGGKLNTNDGNVFI